MPTEASPEPAWPLTPAALLILLVLAVSRRHGYGIMKEVETMTEGRARLGPGTLYRTLRRLLEDGLIAEEGQRPVPEEVDERRG